MTTGGLVNLLNEAAASQRCREIANWLLEFLVACGWLSAAAASEVDR